MMMLMSTPVEVGPMVFWQDIRDVSGIGGDVEYPQPVIFVTTNAVDIPQKRWLFQAQETSTALIRVPYDNASTMFYIFSLFHLFI